MDTRAYAPLQYGLNVLRKLNLTTSYTGGADLSELRHRRMSLLVDTTHDEIQRYGLEMSIALPAFLVRST